MRVLLVGLSHRTAPVELRERVDFSRGDMGGAVSTLASRVVSGEGVIVSTCNRVEIYTLADAEDGTGDQIAAFVSDHHGVPRGQLDPHVYTRWDGDAVRHLFRVAAGLDSLVVGEPQILGQVKEAYEVAVEKQATGGTLNRLFHAAFAAAKRVRSETGLAEGAVSVSYAAIALARKIFGKLTGLKVLILGAGEMAELTATHLKGQEVASLVVASRTLATAQALAETVGGLAVPWEAMPSALADADILVAATGASEPVMSGARVAEVMRHRQHRPLFIIDIAVPRDVEAAAGDLEQVFLYNIDDLQAIVTENLARRSAELQQAEAIVSEEVDKFAAWLRSRTAVPTVVALRQRFEKIRQSELKRLEPKLASLPPDARARVDEITRLIVEKLLLTPTEQLKASDEQMVSAYSEALSRLFSLGETSHDRTPPAASRGEKR
ncbi:MAG TPA: glutamyl-tRNA reductase [Vicinamibacterales bacterium]|nr:glutamyl-tRNA reductase [Vicinamibacterales bacterium]